MNRASCFKCGSHKNKKILWTLCLSCFLEDVEEKDLEKMKTAYFNKEIK